MGTVSITKEFSFEMAHALTGNSGECANIHGHSYKLFVTVKGKIVSEKNHPSNGMIIDFSELKKLVYKSVVEEFDHALVIRKSGGIFSDLKKHKLKIVVTPFQPTCENLLLEFAMRIKKDLPKNILLVRLKLQETPTSSAEWNGE